MSYILTIFMFLVREPPTIEQLLLAIDLDDRQGQGELERCLVPYLLHCSDLSISICICVLTPSVSVKVSLICLPLSLDLEL